MPLFNLPPPPHLMLIKVYIGYILQMMRVSVYLHSMRVACFSVLVFFFFTSTRACMLLSHFAMCVSCVLECLYTLRCQPTHMCICAKARQRRAPHTNGVRMLRFCPRCACGAYVAYAGRKGALRCKLRTHKADHCAGAEQLTGTEHGCAADCVLEVTRRILQPRRQPERRLWHNVGSPHSRAGGRRFD